MQLWKRGERLPSAYRLSGDTRRPHSGGVAHCWLLPCYGLCRFAGQWLSSPRKDLSPVCTGPSTAGVGAETSVCGGGALPLGSSERGKVRPLGARGPGAQWHTVCSCFVTNGKPRCRGRCPTGGNPPRSLCVAGAGAACAVAHTRTFPSSERAVLPHTRGVCPFRIWGADGATSSHTGGKRARSATERGKTHPFECTKVPCEFERRVSR